MTYFSRLPRWLAGAFLLFTAPAFAYPAVALNCSTVQYFRSHYSEAELRQMAKDHGYTAQDIAAAEACMPPAPKAAPLEHGKRSPTLPPAHTLPAKAPAAAPAAPVVVIAPVAAPAVVVEAPKPAPESPVKTSWLWDFLQYLVGILLVGSALGIGFTFVRNRYSATTAKA